MAQQVMSVVADLHLHYVQACQNLSQPENPFIARVLQEADKKDEISTKGITLKLAGNDHLVPVPRVTDDDLAVLVSVLGQAAFVTGLDLAYNLLTDVGAKSMAVFLQENSTLQYLNLMFNDIGTSGAELIAGALHSNQSLVHLRMTGNRIGNQGGMFFASMLKINSTLKKLDLGDCDVGLRCLIATAIALTQNKSLKAINLNRPLLSSQQEETTVHIARMLRSNSSLVELHLGKHEMKNFGVERLCDALYENSTLRYLDLSCNNIICDGAKFLGELLRKNQTLEILDLDANRIEDVGAIYLSEALATRNRTLKAHSRSCSRWSACSRTARTWLPTRWTGRFSWQSCPTGWPSTATGARAALPWPPAPPTPAWKSSLSRSICERSCTPGHPWNPPGALPEPELSLPGF
ncbi:leucine-rich repeat-containing protein 34 isoform X3 [Agelaius tricolor]|uniref:leucine-rich repeat-containing protein 34 isoform X3 n=1 Tax=Agelaius tricolor TaxID=9191 RepID=UPI0039F21A96